MLFVTCDNCLLLFVPCADCLLLFVAFQKADVSVKSSALAEENEKLRKDVDDLKNKLNVLVSQVFVYRFSLHF